MFELDLYRTMLLEPVRKDPGLDSLFVVSGYATAAMAYRHLADLERFKSRPMLHLVCGMAARDGLAVANHKGFVSLVSDRPYGGRVHCDYVVKGNPVHAKVYVWCSGAIPVRAFAGSANYSQTALGYAVTREVMVEVDPVKAFSWVEKVRDVTLPCTDPAVKDLVSMYVAPVSPFIPTRIAEHLPPLGRNVDSVSTTLLVEAGWQRSALNWGQRDGREPNQAYIRLTKEAWSTDFFPAVGVRFTVLTDDGQAFVCTRAQANGKAIETPHNNSLIGKYFRERIGVRDGALVTLKDLDAYGRRDVQFFKIDDETYFMDFSVKRI